MTAKKPYEPNQITLSESELEALEQRLQAGQLTHKDIKILLSLIEFNRWMQDRLSRAKLTIKRLRQLFGFKSESRKKSEKKSHDAAANHSAAAAETSPDESTAPTQDSHSSTNRLTPHWNAGANHGRTAANDYTGCPITSVPLDNPLLQQGKCPLCAQCQTDARVVPVAPKVVVILHSQPLISGDRYALEQVRCTVCQTYFAAPKPDHLQGRHKYEASCRTAIAIHHYYAGLPFKRLETLQQLQGVPLADATQYDLMQQLYGTVVRPVSDILRYYAAQGRSFFFDDTPGRILDQIHQNRQAPSRSERTGIHTTALISEYEAHRIYLFDTTALTAGQQFKALLDDRQSEAEFRSMSDASASNFPQLNDHLMARWIITLCLVHSRRQFVDLLGDGDADIQLVLDIMAEVYHHEKYCRQHQLSDEQRLSYHQQYSEPKLNALKVWLNNRLLYRQVEPNSDLGQAIIYLLKRWHWLTQFVRVPGAALDNNLCEQAIKIAIRYRKNALFYKSYYGATIGDAMMSVLHTAAVAQVNVFDYLNTLQDQADLVQQTPEDWLPWNYLQTLSQQASPEPRVVNSS